MPKIIGIIFTYQKKLSIYIQRFAIFVYDFFHKPTFFKLRNRHFGDGEKELFYKISK